VYPLAEAQQAVDYYVAQEMGPAGQQEQAQQAQAQGQHARAQAQHAQGTGPRGPQGTFVRSYANTLSALYIIP